MIVNVNVSIYNIGPLRQLENGPVTASLPSQNICLMRSPLRSV